VKGTGGDRSRWRPTTRETADHSTPFAVAVTLMDGELTTRSYSDARMRDLATLALMDRIKVTANAEMTRAYPATAQTRIAVATEDGISHAHLQRHPKGNTGNPLSDSELADKFERLYGPLSMGCTVGEALDALWSVDRMEQASRLVDLVRRKS
jgi:2-methylcitrate dehydratase